MRFLALDTEDDSKGNVYLINFFDGETHYTFTDKREAWDFLINFPVNKIFAHNLEYDLINLAFPFFMTDLEFYYVSGRLLYATIYNTRKKFFDSFNFSFSSLKNIGKSIGLEKLDSGKDFNNVVYCRRDTEIVYKFIRDFNMQLKEEFKLTPKTTLAGTAQKIYLKRFSKDFYLGGKNTNRDLLGAYYGGRCEAFKIGHVDSYVFETDINSCYPYVMKTGLYPISDNYETKKPETELYVAQVKVKVKRDTTIPILPYRKDRLYFPTGEFTTWVCSPELNRAKEENQIEDITYIKTLNFPETDYVFSDYVDYFYTKRKEAKKEKNSFKDLYYKLVLNSTYGRFALTGGLQKITFDENLRSLSETITIESTKSINYAVALLVTAYGRLQLFSLIQKVQSAGGEVIYSDTDSVYFTFTHPIDLQDTIVRLHTDLSISPDLGDNSLAVYRSGYFHTAKQYFLTTLYDSEKLKCKGIPEQSRKEFFQTGKANYKRPVKLRTFTHSVDKTTPPNYWKDFLIEQKGEYKKRKVIGNGFLKDTKPIHF